MIDGTLLNQIESCINDTVVNIKQINTGYVNDVFLINLTQNKYIIKFFMYFDKNKIEPSIALQKFLSERGMAPSIVSEGVYGSTPYIIPNMLITRMQSRIGFYLGRHWHYNIWFLMA